MADTTIKRHPIRGFLWGILFGLGLMLIAVGQGYAALGTWPPLVLFVVGLVVGTLWGIYGPAKKPKGAPPPTPVEVEQTDRGAAFESADAADADADATEGDGGGAFDPPVVDGTDDD